MHDVGTFVWVVLVVIGVVSSIVSNARKRGAPVPGVQPRPPVQPPQRQAQQAASPSLAAPLPPGLTLADLAQAARAAASAPQPAAPQPAPVPRPVRIRPPATSPQPLPGAEHTLDVFRPARRRGPHMFQGRGALVRAVVGAEILGKPLALRDD